jgi:hypothetical protein
LEAPVGEIQMNLDKLKLPIGYTYEIGGQYQSQAQAFRELLMVFGLAVVLVFTILVIQFRAWTPAILILLAAPSRSAARSCCCCSPHRPQHLVGDGRHPARRARRQKRDHVARFLREASRGRRVI